jgi:hypothetical protein
MLPIAGVCCLVACGPETSDDSPADERANALADVTGTSPITATEYVTDIQFLPFEAATTRGLILQFANVARSGGLHLRYTGWQLIRSGWRNLLDSDFDESATRAPWRLFPNDSLRVTVTDDGDPDALVLRAAAGDYTLDLLNHLDGWEDRAGTRHEIREAVLIQRGQRVPGVAVQHRFAVPVSDGPALYGPYERAVLTSEDGAIIVLFHSRLPDKYGDPFAWMYADGLTRRWTDLEARTVEVANSAQLRRNIPVRMWFRIPEPDITCELTAAERWFNEVSVEEGPKPYNALSSKSSN